jgi:hypothetical protein
MISASSARFSRWPLKPGLGQINITLDSKILQERSTLQVRRVKRVALAEIAGLVAAAKPADALFGTAVRK